MIDGMYKKVWESNYVQFPRLISEIVGVGLTRQQEEALCRSMDLCIPELHELFQRADDKWERIKAAYKKREERPRGKKRVVRSV